MRVNPFALMLSVTLLIPTVGSCASPEETSATEGKNSDGEEKIVWGKESNGLVANLRALTTDMQPGDPIEFEIRVKNVSNEEVFLPGHKQLSPFAWSFNFGQWEWSILHSLPIVPLEPGDTASVRCLVATTRDSLTDEQKERRFNAVPFRSVKDPAKKLVRLPEGSYRVRASSWIPGSRVRLETNTIEVRVSERS